MARLFRPTPAPRLDAADASPWHGAALDRGRPGVPAGGNGVPCWIVLWYRSCGVWDRIRHIQRGTPAPLRAQA